LTDSSVNEIGKTYIASNATTHRSGIIPGEGPFGWLANQITVQDVTVQTQDGSTGGTISGPPLPDSAIAIQVTYVLIETQTVTQTEVQVI
jgi:hypothetical protein